MYVSMSREYSDNGLFDKVLILCSILNVKLEANKKFQNSIFRIRLRYFYQDRERERERMI